MSWTSAEHIWLTGMCEWMNDWICSIWKRAFRSFLFHLISLEVTHSELRLLLSMFLLSVMSICDGDFLPKATCRLEPTSSLLPIQASSPSPVLLSFDPSFPLHPPLLLSCSSFIWDMQRHIHYIVMIMSSPTTELTNEDITVITEAPWMSPSTCISLPKSNFPLFFTTYTYVYTVLFHHF